MVELIETLQQSKLSQISQLQACFSGSEGNDAPQTLDTRGPDLLQSESFATAEEGDEDGSDDFEDLRL